jgi:peptide/nickel transport system substrate-binding protein
LKKFFASIVATILLSVSLSACSPNGIQAGSIINIAETNDFNSFNADNTTSDASLAVNAEISNLINPSFYYTDAAGKLVANEEFGSVTVVSKSPLKVAYQLTGKAKWSDGQALTADDLLLSWLAARNPADSGFDSVRKGSGLKWTTSTPVVSSDKKTLTVTYDRAVADWQTALTITGAAHVVAERAFDISDASAALIRFEQAIATASVADQTLISEQYGKAYLAREAATLPLVTAGAYTVENFSPVTGLTLKANSSFTWGPLPKIETVKIKFFADATAMLAAMQQGEIDICAPAESGIATNSDLISLAKAASAKYQFAASHDIEAVLLNFASTSAFASANTDVVKAAAIKDAFLKLIPRAKILSALSADNPVLESKSWIYANSSNYYAPFVQSNGSAAFDLQNAELAGELLKSANVSTPVDVRVLFDSNNPRAKKEFTLLGEYATAAGFNLIDASAKDPRTVFTTGEYDAFITTVPLAGEAGGDPYWFTGSSVTGFADPNLDKLLVDYSSKAEALDQIAVLKQVDAELYAAKFGLPLYQLPALLVYGKRIKTIVGAPNGGSATYGYWNWALGG